MAKACIFVGGIVTSFSGHRFLVEFGYKNWSLYTCEANKAAGRTRSEKNFMLRTFVKDVNLATEFDFRSEGQILRENAVYSGIRLFRPQMKRLFLLIMIYGVSHTCTLHTGLHRSK